ncbi:hypothetical protein ACLBWT_13275 [Paenibacillus sp. D51F]
MYVKVYSYRIKPDKRHEFLELQKKAGERYGRELVFRTHYLNSSSDPDSWMELTWYKDEETYRKGMRQLEGDEELSGLFRSFEELLAEGTAVAEMDYEERLVLEVGRALEDEES